MLHDTQTMPTTRFGLEELVQSLPSVIVYDLSERWNCEFSLAKDTNLVVGRTSAIQLCACGVALLVPLDLDFDPESQTLGIFLSDRHSMQRMKYNRNKHTFFCTTNLTSTRKGEVRFVVTDTKKKHAADREKERIRRRLDGCYDGDGRPLLSFG